MAPPKICNSSSTTTANWAPTWGIVSVVPTSPSTTIQTPVHRRKVSICVIDYMKIDMTMAKTTGGRKVATMKSATVISLPGRVIFRIAIRPTLIMTNNPMTSPTAAMTANTMIARTTTGVACITTMRGVAHIPIARTTTVTTEISATTTIVNIATSRGEESRLICYDTFRELCIIGTNRSNDRDFKKDHTRDSKSMRMRGSFLTTRRDENEGMMV